MNSRLIYAYVIGLLALCLLFFLAVSYYSKQIPTVIEDDARDRLGSAGANWATVKAVNRDLVVTGRAPTPEEHQTAISALKHVSAVRYIQDDTTKNIVSPYAMSVEWRDDKLIINGYVPDAQSQQKVVEILQQKYDDKDISQQIKIAQGQPEKWTELMSTILNNIPTLDRANVDLTDQDLELSAQTAKTADKDKLLQSLEPFKEYGYNINAQITADDTVRLRCQGEFDTLLNEAQILFASGKATIKKTSHELLDQLAKTALGCPDSFLDIAGHTDSQGRKAKNTALSRERAQSVAQWLIKRGVDKQRIKTIGYGSERPIADNSSESGRTKNRRIEFIVRNN